MVVAATAVVRAAVAMVEGVRGGVRAAAERAAARAGLLPQARDVGGCAPGWPLPRQW